MAVGQRNGVLRTVKEAMTNLRAAEREGATRTKDVVTVRKSGTSLEEHQETPNSTGRGEARRGVKTPEVPAREDATKKNNSSANQERKYL
jgi:hypothetical protein